LSSLLVVAWLPQFVFFSSRQLHRYFTVTLATFGGTKSPLRGARGEHGQIVGSRHEHVDRQLFANRSPWRSKDRRV